MRLESINLASVPHAACMGNIRVIERVWVDKVQGDIGSIIGKLKCSWVFISNMQLCVCATQMLVAGMAAGVGRVRLGYDGSVEVDMETLASYDGRGRCWHVQCCYKTGDRYRDQVRRWAGRIGWKVTGDNSRYISIERR